MIAIISGVNGQDGSYLAEMLLEKEYKVVGFSRRTGANSTHRILPLLSNADFTYLEGDITDPTFVYGLISEIKPDEFYNMAAQSHVGVSFTNPASTNDINYSGVLNILDAIKNTSPSTKLLQCSTSEMFGKSYSLRDGLAYQDENTKFEPQSPYAISKLAAHHACRIYRESYGLFICSSILFNHESPRRGENFLTRKITKWIGEFLRWEKSNPDYLIKDEVLSSFTGEFPKLRLGNLSSYRDWGHARDYVACQWLMMQQLSPDDYVVGTGESHSGLEFLKLAFKYAGIDNYEDYYVVDPKFYRPCEVDYLRVDASKVKEKLGWTPTTSFTELVREMVEHDTRI